MKSTRLSTEFSAMMSLRHAILDTAPVGAVTLPNSAGQQLFRNPWETASAGPQATNKKTSQNMKILKMLLEKCIGRATCHAKLSDIKGHKSGGTRDANKVDWRASTSS